MWPGLDRCATIGFRCAVDFLPDEDAPSVPQANVKTWVDGTGTWNTPSAWKPTGVPTPKDTVVISGRSSQVMLTQAAKVKDLWVTQGATLIFSNLAAVVDVTSDTICSGGTVTHVINSDTNDTDGWQVDGRVYIVCPNFPLATYGAIDVNAKGFQPLGTGKGAGPGGGEVAAGSKNPGGGGHGGRDGNG